MHNELTDSDLRTTRIYCVPSLLESLSLKGPSKEVADVGDCNQSVARLTLESNGYTETAEVWTNGNEVYILELSDSGGEPDYYQLTPTP